MCIYIDDQYIVFVMYIYIYIHLQDSKQPHEVSPTQDGWKVDGVTRFDSKLCKSRSRAHPATMCVKHVFGSTWPTGMAWRVQRPLDIRERKCCEGWNTLLTWLWPGLQWASCGECHWTDVQGSCANVAHGPMLYHQPSFSGLCCKMGLVGPSSPSLPLATCDSSGLLPSCSCWWMNFSISFPGFMPSSSSVA